ncbi:MAG: phenylalanine--tRNA ligase subunit alpha, partial [Candidatus Nitrosotenuis sp.]|nr:phenylalanine--tRNA ligase subunit alpha [Candidatus Nitrosotenuis sp.]
MSHVLHPIEKTIIKLLKTVPSLTEQEIAEKSSLSADQTRRGIEWLKLKNLANVVESEELFVSLGKNGVVARQEGLPERKLVNLLIAKPVLLDKQKKKL